MHSNTKSNPAIFANEANLWLIFKESSITFPSIDLLEGLMTRGMTGGAWRLAIVHDFQHVEAYLERADAFHC